MLETCNVASIEKKFDPVLAKTPGVRFVQTSRKHFEAEVGGMKVDGLVDVYSENRSGWPIESLGLYDC